VHPSAAGLRRPSVGAELAFDAFTMEDLSARGGAHLALSFGCMRIHRGRPFAIPEALNANSPPGAGISINIKLGPPGHNNVLDARHPVGQAHAAWFFCWRPWPSHRMRPNGTMRGPGAHEITGGWAFASQTKPMTRHDPGPRRSCRTSPSGWVPASQSKSAQPPS
jgi:hypothetical protein